MVIMVGAQRSSVTIALHGVEGASEIRSAQGRVITFDRDRRNLSAASQNLNTICDAVYVLS